MTLHHGDCLDVMAGMEPESVDAVVTDPPYGLGFMGKAWDHGAPGVPFWTEMLRVAKPSAYLLAFGGTRTVHRIASSIEDAGWVIRDMLVWAYASGFPKSKASLKPAWEPIVMARKPGPPRMLAIDECRLPVADAEPNKRTTPVASVPGMFGVSGHNGMLQQGRWPANVILTDPIFDGGVEGVVGGGRSDPPGGPGRQESYPGGEVVNLTGDHAQGRLYFDGGTYSRFFLIPKSDRADREPIVPDESYMLHRARGECDKLGAWDNADQSPSDRMGNTSPARATYEVTSPAIPTPSSSDTSSPGSLPTDPSPPDTRSTTGTGTSRTTDSTTSPSLIPSPTSASIPAASSETASGGSPATSAGSSSLWEPPTGISVVRAGRSTDAAARATSASLSSRSVCGRCGKRLPRVSTHPTVKPVDLMRHLVRLVTPTGGIVLDPFLGSGTTAIAAEMEGFEWVGIEREAEYVAIAEARLNGVQKGLGLPA